MWGHLLTEDAPSDPGLRHGVHAQNPSASLSREVKHRLQANIKLYGRVTHMAIKYRERMVQHFPLMTAELHKTKHLKDLFLSGPNDFVWDTCFKVYSHTQGIWSKLVCGRFAVMSDVSISRRSKFFFKQNLGQHLNSAHKARWLHEIEERHQFPYVDQIWKYSCVIARTVKQKEIAKSHFA